MDSIVTEAGAPGYFYGISAMNRRRRQERGKINWQPRLAMLQASAPNRLMEMELRPQNKTIKKGVGVDG
jgi:hypothetical protein